MNSKRSKDKLSNKLLIGLILSVSLIVLIFLGYTYIDPKRDRVHVEKSPDTRLPKTGKDHIQAKLDKLISASQSANEIIRRKAIWELWKIRDQRAVDALISIIGSENETKTNREVAVYHLSLMRLYLKDFNVDQQLIDLLKNNTPEIRQYACYALGRIGSKIAALPLIELLNDNDKNVRFYAVMAIDDIGGFGYEVNELAIDPLIQALQDDYIPLRRRAASALGKFKDKRVVEPLIEALKNADSVKDKAIQSLGILKDPRATLPLLECLRDCPEHLHGNVIQALGNIGDKRAVPALISILKYGTLKKTDRFSIVTAAYARSPAPPSIRVLAAHALGRIGDKRAVDALTEALKDKDEQVKWAAIVALADIGDLRALVHLEALLTRMSARDQKSLLRAMDRLRRNVTITRRTAVGIENGNSTPSVSVRKTRQRYLRNNDGTLTDTITGQVKSRFVDNGDTTVTDLLTGLMWLKTPKQLPVNYEDAVEYCRALKISNYAGWRLPTLSEWMKVVDKSKTNPSLPLGHPFTEVVTDVRYWSETRHKFGPLYFYQVNLSNGKVSGRHKNKPAIVWPVRGAK